MAQKTLNGDSVKKEGKVTKTLNGYEVDEVVSALQKEIRRGREEQAAWWTRELVLSGLDWRLWRRMKIIAVEDVWNYDAINIVMNLEWAFRKMKGDSEKISGDAMLFPIKCAIILARMKKDRTADDIICYFDDMQKKLEKMEQRGLDWKPEIPEYAKDVHTKAGREGKTWAEGEAEFWFETSKLENESEEYNKKYLEHMRKKWGWVREKEKERE